MTQEYCRKTFEYLKLNLHYNFGALLAPTKHSTP
jgi:hypothetical protein